MNIYVIRYIHLVMFTIIFTACENSNTPTQGEEKIYIDESYSPLIRAEIEAFEGFYKEANITDLYKSEGDLLKNFMQDSCRIIVLNRDLSAKEIDYFKSKNSFPITTRIAIDAIAFITNKKNPISELLYSEVENIFSGKITQWKLLDSSIKDASYQDTSITIVFDNVSSSNVRLLREKLLNGNEFPKNCYGASSNMEVVDYVSKHKGALGVIGVNWISDIDDTLTRKFMNKINVLGVSSKENIGEFFQPYQAYIYTKEYPFCRDVYIINREGRTGLGTGFAAFLASDKGQLIILKSGMVPVTQPIRMVQVTNK